MNRKRDLRGASASAAWPLFGAHAFVATPIQSQLVVLHLKALGCQAIQIPRTFVHIKNALALIALEVMVVTMMDGLKSRAFTRQHHCRYLLRLQQLF